LHGLNNAVVPGLARHNVGARGTYAGESARMTAREVAGKRKSISVPFLRRTNPKAPRGRQARRALFYSDLAANLLMSLRAKDRYFSECALKLLPK
jgi:hypothetical protein